MKTHRLALSLVGMLMLSACSSLNPFSSEGKLPALKPLASPVGMSASWRARVDEAGVFVFQPAVIGGAVFAVGKDGEVARIESGRSVWKTPLKTAVSGGVGSDGNIVVVGTPKGEVVALDAATGQVKWRILINAEVLAAPAVSGGMVIVRSADSRLFGLDASDGRRRWTYQRATPPLALRNAAGVVTEGNFIIAGYPGGKLVAVNGANGTLAWEGTVAIPRGATELERVADITSLPVVTPRATCAVAYQGRVACFDMSNGSTLWTRDLSSSKGLDLDDRNVYVTDEKGAVHALDLANGASAWKQDQLAGRNPGRPRVVGDYIVVGDVEGYVHLLRTADGSLAGRHRVDSSPILADPQKAGGDIVIQTRNGSIQAIEVQ